MAGIFFRGKRLLYSRLRSVTCAALIVFATILAVGSPVALRIALEQPRVAANDTSEPGSTARRELPWITRHASNSGPIEILPAPETAVAEPLRKADLFAPSDQPAPLAMAAPVQEERTALATVEPAIQVPPAQIESSQAEKPVVERKGAAKTAARTPAKPPVTAEQAPPQRTRTARASTREAWGVMRRFDERSRIPVDAYSADGAPRRIIIRPTSIQDVYYYNSR
jgi:hypothetical protein